MTDSICEVFKNSLPNECEIYKQPLINGERPDYVIIREGYGVAVILTRNAHTEHYEVLDDGNWRLKLNGKEVRSLCSIAEGIKTSLIKNHIDGLAVKYVLNKNFKKSISAFVFMPENSKSDIDKFFSSAQQATQDGLRELNMRFKRSECNQADYDKEYNNLDRVKRRLQYNRSMIVGNDQLARISNAFSSENILLDDALLESFYEYLKLQIHDSSDGKSVSLSKLQNRLIVSAPELKKVKGVAGCGKTTVLAHRAVNASLRHNSEVLILTFNKTLRNYIKYSIRSVPQTFTMNKFAITHYHEFIAMNIRSAGIVASDILSAANKPETFLGFESDLYKYKTIIVDEIQDYEKVWVEILKTYFLEDEGEMVLLGDESQNIYERSIDSNDFISIRGFGPWEKMTTSFRNSSGTILHSKVIAFQQERLSDNYETRNNELDAGKQNIIATDIFECAFIDSLDDINEIYLKISAFLKLDQINPYRTAILASEIETLRAIEQRLRCDMSFATHITFETQEEFEFLQDQRAQTNQASWQFENDLETIRSGRKLSFDNTVEALKISTIHSYKGLEADSVVYIEVDRDTDEIVYTALTRSSINFLGILSKESKYLEFFTA